ncbi:unnamed protein product [Withania somnifera]
MVVAQKLKESEITEQDSLLLTRNLLRIAIFNISYIRGLFPEKYFSDKSVPALEMKIKKLMPMDAESRRLIDWMEKGVYDALQKKYLKTLLFCVCEAIDGPVIEEYAFSFGYPSSNSEEVSMNVNRIGTKKGGTIKCNSTTEITPNQMRSSACKMVRTLVQLMRTLDKMPEERTILMKLLYHDDVTPADYEPPFFRCCTDKDSLNPWMKNPLKLEVGNVNSKHLVLALKVKSVLDPCEDENDDNQDDVMSLGADSSGRDSSSDSEFNDSDEDQYIVAPVEKQNVQDNGDMVDEGILEMLIKEEILSSASIDTYIIKKQKKFDYEFDVVKEETECRPNKNNNQSQQGKGEDYMYMKALFHVLPMNYVTVAKLQNKLEGEANQIAVKWLIDKMKQDGFIEAKNYRRLGKRVIRSDLTEEKLAEVKKVLAKDNIDVDMHESGALHSIGSDLTRTRGKSDAYRNGSVVSDQTVSKRKEHENTLSSKAEPVASRESFVPGKENGRVNAKANQPEYEIVCSRSSQDKGHKKASTVKEPIPQYVKRQKSQVA